VDSVTHPQTMEPGAVIYAQLSFGKNFSLPFNINLESITYQCEGRIVVLFPVDQSRVFKQWIANPVNILPVIQIQMGKLQLGTQYLRYSD